ncbi:MAG: hypothetical protein HW421_1004 [Ignavibacteria bacterium]|nr:hypothetical protein [Ignavibacteria bacterium]
MKKILIFLAIVTILTDNNTVYAQNVDQVINNITSIDPKIKKYFPRWRICEKDLQAQIYQAFLVMRYDEKELDINNIEVLAAPQVKRSDDERKKDPSLVEAQPYQLLLLSCGRASMNSVQISSKLGDIEFYLSGEMPYGGKTKSVNVRDYCLVDIAPEVPFSRASSEAIINFLEPTDATHLLSFSLFEQVLKFGETGFWFRSVVGNDELGYPFWTSGESKLIIKKPLYVNDDIKTIKRIPYLINFSIGAAYRLTTGTETNSPVFDWIPARKLNSHPAGKLIVGFDFHLPMQPLFGISFNASIPIQDKKDEIIKENTYAFMPSRTGVDFNASDERFRHKDIYLDINNNTHILKIAPVLKSSGQVTLFYNVWLNDKPNKPAENYFRFEAGISYLEVAEYGQFYNMSTGNHISDYGIDGLRLYKNNEFGDWLFLKVDFKNNATWPLGLSLQISNQTLLGRAVIPLIGNWLYLEGKFSSLMRPERPYESKSFYMISPIVKLTIK